MNKIKHQVIKYRGKLWYFLMRTKKRVRKHYRLYYISADKKAVIDWDYSKDFVIMSIKKFIRKSKIDPEVIKNLEVEVEVE